MEPIDKADIVAEIKKRLLPVVRDKHYDEWEEGRDSERIAILGILDTLEVKEVDLEKEIRKWQQKHFEGIGYVLDGSGDGLEEQVCLILPNISLNLVLKHKKEVYVDLGKIGKPIADEALNRCYWSVWYLNKYLELNKENLCVITIIIREQMMVMLLRRYQNKSFK